MIRPPGEFGSTAAAVFLVLFGLLVGMPCSADSPPTLRFDPFRERETRVVEDSPAERRVRERVFRPVLQSTVVGEKSAQAMLGGVALRIGESTNGYRLIAVGTFDALFVKDGERIRLEVDRGRGEAR